MEWNGIIGWGGDCNGDALFSLAVNLLGSRGWDTFICNVCGRRYLARSERETCQSPQCSRLLFDAGSGHRAVSLSTLWYRLRQEFTRWGYSERRLDDLHNRHGEPLFVIAAIQNFDDVFYLGAPPPKGAFFIGQPSIRMRYFDAIGEKEGFSTAFVNVGSYEFNDPANSYRTHLAHWLTALATVGLNDSGITFTLEVEPFNAGPYFGRYLIVNYRGIEIGEAILISRARTSDGRELVMVEFSFGLERILWAVNRTAAYHRNIGPLIARIDDDALMIDSARTATLMAMAGFVPRQGQRGYLLRKQAVRFAKVMNGRDISGAVHECYTEWLPFLSPVRNVGACIELLRKEIKRHDCLTLARQLGIKDSQVVNCMTLEDLIRQLLKRGLSIDVLCNCRVQNRNKTDASF